MIVQCPSCASRYRIRDANIPPSGGKIRCPSCSHSFVVYPEAEAEDEDRTSVTSQNEISSLVNKMATPGRPGLPATGQDYVSTQIAQGTDQARAMAALANELGDPMDMDGTVEIQNPMQVWQQAQNALAATRAAAAAAESSYDEDEFDHSPTEVVDAAALSAAFGNNAPPAAVSRSETYAPTEPQNSLPGQPSRDSGPQYGQSPEPAHQYPATAPNAAVQQPSPSPDQYGSGQYSPNTPPGGRHTGESWDGLPPQAPPARQQQQHQHYSPEPVRAPGPPPQPNTGPPPRPNTGFGNAGGFDRSPSGLTGAALFGDMGDEPDPPPPTFPESLPPLNSNGPMNTAGAPPQKMSAPAMQPAASGSGAGDHPGPWKLKTNFGLTYEFPDTRGLRSWLSSREELDGYTVSADDGGTFHPLGSFPQLDRNAGRTPSMSGNMSVPNHGSGMYRDPTGSGQFPEPHASQSGLNAYGSGLHTAPNANPTTGVKGPLVNSEYRPPSRDKGKGVLWLVFLLLVTLAVGIGLEKFEIFSITGMVRDLGILPPAETKGSPTDVKTTPDKTDDTSATLDPEQLAKKQAAEVERLLKDAERLVNGNKLPAALETLKTTEQLAADNPMVFDLRAQVYDKLGKADEAEAERAKAEALRAPAVPEGDDEPSDEDPEGTAEPDNAE